MPKSIKSMRWAAGLAAGYLLVAGAWISVSGSLAATNAASLEELQRLELLKGWAFVSATALVLFFGSRFAFRRMETASHELLQRERAMISSERRVFAGLIASSVAHDANNVLAVVLTELQLLKNHQIEAEALARIKEALDHLVQLNRRLVQTGRQARTSLQPMDLCESVQEAVELVRHHPALHETKLTVEMPASLQLNGNPLFISQIVTNLVVNAGEATGGKGAVQVKVATEDERVRLEVLDDGPGIPPERREGLFDALVTTKPHGNGMGLFSVKAAAQAMGGGVWVEDNPGGGARFVVSLPLRLRV